MASRSRAMTLSRFETVFGLAFDVTKSHDTISGFQPAESDLGAGKFLFGDLRLEGFAAMMRLGFSKKLVLVGGDEGRYKDERPVINRAQVRHPRQRRWLDEWGRLKGDRTLAEVSGC